MLAFGYGTLGGLKAYCRGTDVVPLDNRIFLVPLGQDLARKPVVGAVEAAQAVLDLVGLSRVEGLLPGDKGRRIVLWMQYQAPALLTGLLEGKPGVLVPAPVAVIEGTVRVSGPDQLWDAVGQKLEILRRMGRMISLG